MAIRNSSPALTLASATSGPNGITTQAASAGMMVITGPRKNSGLLAAVGRMISLKISFTASAIGVSRPKRADAVRARAQLGEADALALPQRQVGHAAHQRQQQRDDLDQAPDARPTASGPSATLPKWLTDRASRFLRPGSTPTAPNIAPSAAVSAWPAACAPCRLPASASSTRGEISTCSPWRTRTAIAAPSGRARPTARSAGWPPARAHRPSAAAIRRGAPARRPRRSARRRCAPGRPCAPADADGSAAPRLSSRAARPDGIAERLGAHLLGAVSCSKPGRPSRLPSTRSTFQAGRVSPSGLTTPGKLCSRPSALTKLPAVSVNGAIGSSTSAFSTSGVLERRQRDDQAAALQRRARGRRRRRRRARARRSAAAAPSSAATASAPAFRPPAPGSAPTSCAPTLLAASPK